MARIVALCVMAQTSWASPAGDALPEASQRIWSAAVEAREQGDTRGEERALRALIRMNPDFAPPWTELADLLVDQGRVEEAVELLSARSMDVDAVARRAQWLLDLARPDEARVLAARLQRLAPESELGLRLRAASWVGDKPLLAHRWLDDWWTHPSRDTLTEQDAELSLIHI